MERYYASTRMVKETGNLAIIIAALSLLLVFFNSYYNFRMKRRTVLLEDARDNEIQNEMLKSRTKVSFYPST